MAHNDYGCDSGCRGDGCGCPCHAPRHEPALPCRHAHIDPSLTCLECGAVVLMQPGPIVPAPTIRRRPPAEVAAYFDGAVAALRMIRARASAGVHVVEIDGMIAIYEAGLNAVPDAG
jgi:hypothetical protein